jgi:hypothetical protein
MEMFQQRADFTHWPGTHTGCHLAFAESDAMLPGKAPRSKGQEVGQ